ncbi:MAG TPA: DUF1326 domain-containing protein [Acidobacteriota bacterium]|jgi:hypothetical protein|nr:DUF1326 domain-containing protein [Acidobacteriota bacterium]
MRTFKLFLWVGLIVLMLSATGWASQIYGDYIETRSADVYTGSCFANSEMGLSGDQAILAWHIRKGEWNGVPLDGLSIVGVAKAKATLGDPFHNPYPANSVLIVDAKANAQQRSALIGFAKEMAGQLLENTVDVEVAPIQMEVEHHGGHPSKGFLRAGDLAGIETRPINESDHLCGNEEAYYPPLAQTAHSMPAVSLLDQYNGPALGVSWTTRDKRNAFVGTFAR